MLLIAAQAASMACPERFAEVLLAKHRYLNQFRNLLLD